jgi:hypothetical protein
MHPLIPLPDTTGDTQMFGLFTWSPSPSMCFVQIALCVLTFWTLFLFTGWVIGVVSATRSGLPFKQAAVEVLDEVLSVF